ncbi:MAG TPA: FKBP-type peptidyl-prolyl cis-trans isomerase [Myxococcales bacterium]|nr:FKBP-type peptidyl-prolyl cis-trans isomerase [Myxococcales bacterium]
MAKATLGDTVQLHFTGRLADGTVFESSRDAGDGEWQNFRGRAVSFAPISVKLGFGEMLPAFEEAVVGLEPGQRATFTVPCERAFGPRRDDLVHVMPRSDLVPGQAHQQVFRMAEGRRHPNHFKPTVGGFVDLAGPDGTTVRALVRDLSRDSITLDTNHPLAGKDLTFEVELVAIAGAE